MGHKKLLLQNLMPIFFDISKVWNFFNLYCRCQTSLWWGPRRRQTRPKRSWKKYKKNFPKVFFLRSGYRANTHSHTIWEKYWRYTIVCEWCVTFFFPLMDIVEWFYSSGWFLGRPFLFHHFGEARKIYTSLIFHV